MTNAEGGHASSARRVVPLLRAGFRNGTRGLPLSQSGEAQLRRQRNHSTPEPGSRRVFFVAGATGDFRCRRHSLLLEWFMARHGQASLTALRWGKPGRSRETIAALREAPRARS